MKRAAVLAALVIALVLLAHPLAGRLRGNRKAAPRDANRRGHGIGTEVRMHAEDTAPPHADTDWDWKIPLRRRDGTARAWTLVDEPDFVAFGQWRWRLNTTGYAVRHQRTAANTYRHAALHRQVLGLEYGDPREGDHINGDRLDNRRGNLRIVTRAEQKQNRVYPGRTSTYRGVSWSKRGNAWTAQAKIAGKVHYLGYFDDEQEAARVAAEYRVANMPFSVPGR